MRGNPFGYANTYCHSDTNTDPNAYSHTNTDGHTFSDTYANARKRFGPNAKSGSRIDLYFFKRDL